MSHWTQTKTANDTKITPTLLTGATYNGELVECLVSATQADPLTEF
jgi:hypothetical protein